MRHHHHYRHHRHGRFSSPWYWLTGAAIIEAELNACWWILWGALNGAAWLVRRWWYVPEPAETAIAACRPIWPSRTAVQRHAGQSQPRGVAP